MTYEEAKKYLKAFRDKKKLVKAKERQIRDAQRQISIPAIDYSKERIKGGECYPLQQRYIERLERLTSEFDVLLSQVFELEDLIQSNLGDLEPIEQTIIVERYMNGKNWRQIEKEYGYSESNPYKIHAKALKKIAKAKSG